MGIRIISGGLTALILTCFILSIALSDPHNDRALVLPGGWSSNNLLGFLIGLLLHIPVIVLSVCLLVTTLPMMDKKNQMFGSRMMLTMNVTTWIRILGMIGILGALLSPANEDTKSIKLTVGNPIWYLYMIIYIFCVIVGGGGLKLSLTEDVQEVSEHPDVKIPIRRRTKKVVRTKRTVKRTRAKSTSPKSAKSRIPVSKATASPVSKTVMFTNAKSTRPKSAKSRIPGPKMTKSVMVTKVKESARPKPTKIRSPASKAAKSRFTEMKGPAESARPRSPTYTITVSTPGVLALSKAGKVTIKGDEMV